MRSLSVGGGEIMLNEKLARPSEYIYNRAMRDICWGKFPGWDFSWSVLASDSALRPTTELWQYHCDIARYNHNIFRRNVACRLTKVCSVLVPLSVYYYLNHTELPVHINLACSLILGYHSREVLGYVLGEIISEIYRLSSMAMGLFLSDKYDAYDHWKILPDNERKHLLSVLKNFLFHWCKSCTIVSFTFITLVMLYSALLPQ